MNLGVFFLNHKHGTAEHRILDFDESGRARVSREAAAAIRQKLCLCGDCLGLMGLDGDQPNSYAIATGNHYDIERVEQDDGSVLVVVASAGDHEASVATDCES